MIFSYTGSAICQYRIGIKITYNCKKIRFYNQRQSEFVKVPNSVKNNIEVQEFTETEPVCTRHETYDVCTKTGMEK
jgi:hypothetical protein